MTGSRNGLLAAVVVLSVAAMSGCDASTHTVSTASPGSVLRGSSSSNWESACLVQRSLTFRSALPTGSDVTAGAASVAAASDHPGLFTMPPDSVQFGVLSSSSVDTAGTGNSLQDQILDSPNWIVAFSGFTVPDPGLAGDPQETDSAASSLTKAFVVVDGAGRNELVLYCH